MWAERAAYRQLLRLCRSADKEPAQLVTLLGRPPRLYHPEAQRVVHAPASKWPFVDEAIWEACGGSTEYAHPVGSAASAARRYYSLARLMGADTLEDMREIGKRLVAARMTAVKLRAVPSSMGPVRTRQIRTRPQVAASQPSTLLRLPAGDDSPLQTGDFLLTHPLSALFQPMYDQAVIVLLRVDRDSDTAQGLILNKPGESNVSKLISAVPMTSAEGTILGPDWPGISWDESSVKSLDPFLDHKVFQGGPIVHDTLDDSVLWLHTHGDIVPDAQEVAPSVFLGGSISTTASMERARLQQGKAGGLRLFRGFAAWSLSQLEIELERGIWIRARAACPSAAFELCLGSKELETAWRAALEAVCLPSLARFPRGSAVDKVLTDVLESHQRAMAMELIESGRG